MLLPCSTIRSVFLQFPVVPSIRFHVTKALINFFKSYNKPSLFFFYIYFFLDKTMTYFFFFLSQLFFFHPDVLTGHVFPITSTITKITKAKSIRVSQSVSQSINYVCLCFFYSAYSCSSPLTVRLSFSVR